ncbi:MAG: hypothetical protein AB1861_03400 [Cyanobacteriota bacterium]
MARRSTKGQTIRYQGEDVSIRFTEELQTIRLSKVCVSRLVRIDDNDEPIGWEQPRIGCSDLVDAGIEEVIALEEQLALAKEIAANFDNFAANPVAWLQRHENKGEVMEAIDEGAFSSLEVLTPEQEAILNDPSRAGLFNGMDSACRKYTVNLSGDLVLVNRDGGFSYGGYPVGEWIHAEGSVGGTSVSINPYRRIVALADGEGIRIEVRSRKYGTEWSTPEIQIDPLTCESTALPLVAERLNIARLIADDLEAFCLNPPAWIKGTLKGAN